MGAARRWREALASWAIPQPILDAAPESPYGFSPAMFARRADWDSLGSGAWAAFPAAADLVAWVRTRLCLPSSRDGEIRAALGDRLVEGPGGEVSFPSRRIVALWWDVPAPGGSAAG